MDQTATRWTPPRLTYGITPLKASFTEERKREVAALQCARIQRLPVDALVVYDLQDESSRTDAERPFRIAGSIGRVPVIPIIATVVTLVMIPQLEVRSLGLGAVLVAVGTALALSASRRGSGRPAP